MSVSSNDEKVADKQIESQVESAERTLTPEEIAFERKTLRHVDLRLLPLLGALYGISLIDRTNLAVARVAGMDRDLRLFVGDRYSLVACFFFVPYIIFQIPSNVLIRKYNPVWLLSSYVVLWGGVQTGMGFVKTWDMLLLTRVFLGVLEAGFFPGMVFIITTWYKRHEVQKRLSLFYLISILFGGFSSILGYALQLMRGVGGLNGWRWIFIMEGIITILLGFIAFIWLPSFPDKNTFLSPEQTKLILDRVERDRGDSVPDEITGAKVRHHLSDWTMWAYALIFMNATMPAYAITYFITIILFSMGYNVAEALILTAPPYVVAAVVCFIFGYFSDRTKKRGVFLVMANIITIIGLLITLYTKNNGARYFGLFMANSGAQASVPLVIGWNSNNIVSQSKRAVSSALVVSAGGIGGIMATTVFRQKDAPLYAIGMWTTIGCQLCTMLVVAILTLAYRKRNRLVKEGHLVAEGQPGFSYTY